TRFTKKGGAELGAKELPATLALMKFFGLQASGGTLDDLSMFATDEKQPVGGTWPLNRQELLKAVQRAPQGLALNPDAASGNGKLVAVVKEGGKDHLDMEFTLKIDMKPGDTPGGGKLDLGKINASGEVTFTARFPADYATGAVSRTMRAVISANVDNPNLSLTSNTRMDLTETVKYLRTSSPGEGGH